MPFQDRNPALNTVQGEGFLRGLLTGDEDEETILKGCLVQEGRSYEAVFDSVLKQRAEYAGVEASSQLGRRHGEVWGTFPRLTDERRFSQLQPLPVHERKGFEGSYQMLKEKYVYWGLTYITRQSQWVLSCL